LAASKNNKSNFILSLGSNSTALPTTMSILSERPALAIFFLAVAAISLSSSIVTTFPSSASL
jgi:cation transport ATPase